MSEFVNVKKLLISLHSKEAYMETEIVIRSDDYQDGFRDAIINVIRIINDNSNLTKSKLVDLLNLVTQELYINKKSDI